MQLSVLTSPEKVLMGQGKLLMTRQNSADNTKKSKKTDYFLEFRVHFCYDGDSRKVFSVS